MDRKILSRSPTIDTEKCVENAGGNRFMMVLIAAERSREISRQHRRDENRSHVYPNITALLELQDGKYGIEYIKKIK
jgi:DNA-directed RNA polymerase subunit K/omega